MLIQDILKPEQRKLLQKLSASPPQRSRSPASTTAKSPLQKPLAIAVQ